MELVVEFIERKGCGCEVYINTDGTYKQPYNTLLRPCLTHLHVIAEGVKA